MKDSVIIVSGGLDSITLLYDKASTIALAISFDYGQNHGAKELPFAEYHCKRIKHESKIRIVYCLVIVQMNFSHRFVFPVACDEC